MSAGVPIPLHLAVHLVGLAAVAGVLAWAWARRRELGSAWVSFAVGALLLGAQHVALGLVVAEGTSWPVYARAMAYAALAVGAAGASRNLAPSLPVVVAVAPVAIHVTAALAGLLAAAAALRGVLQRGGLLAGGIVLWAGSDMLLRSSPVTAGWAAIAGSLLVFGWTATAANTSVRARILAATTLLALAAVVLVSAATGTLFAEQLRDDAVSRLRTPAALVVQDVTETWPDELAGQLRTTARLPTTVEVFTRLGGGQEVELAELVRQTGDGDLVVLLDRTGVARAATWRGAPAPAAWLPTIAGLPQVQAASASLEPQVGSALLRADGPTRTVLAGFAATPVLPRSRAGLDERLGILFSARLVDDADVQRRARGLAADVLVLAGDEVIQSTRAVADDGPLVAAIRAGQSQVEANGVDLLVAAVDGPVVGVPVDSAVVDEVGAFGDTESDTARRIFQRSLLVLLLALLAGVVASRWLARPVRQLTGAVDRVAAGDLDSAFRLERGDLERRGDEFSRLAIAFEQMTTSLATRQAALHRAATTEAELRSRLQAITDSMSDGLLATDRRGVVTSCNPAAARLLGLRVGEVVGRPMAEVLQARTDQGAELAQALAVAADEVGPDGTTPVEVEARMEATGLDVRASASPLRGAEGDAPVVGSVVVLRDVSREAELARARRDFVTNISHELRTPLTLIMAPVRQLEKWRTNEDVAALQSEILNRGTARMARLERELTEWAQIELGRYATITGTAADLDEVRKRSIDLVAWQFPDREIRLKVARGLPPIALSNEALQTILRELVHNAVLFSKHDAGRVDVTFRKVEGGVELEVRDRGVGMSPETIARAFEPYWQLDPSERRDFDGLGIGLTLAQRVARAAGTEVVLASRPGRGTTATVLLPVH